VTNPFDDPDGIFFVLRNADGQHSLWPVAIDVPLGWQVVYPENTRQACLDYVDTHWTDLRPLGLAQAMDAGTANPED
jgi:MbtH protein